jgi:hypothetical protein
MSRNSWDKKASNTKIFVHSAARVVKLKLKRVNRDCKRDPDSQKIVEGNLIHSIWSFFSLFHATIRFLIRDYFIHLLSISCGMLQFEINHFHLLKELKLLPVFLRCQLKIGQISADWWSDLENLCSNLILPHSLVRLTDVPTAAIKIIITNEAIRNNSKCHYSHPIPSSRNNNNKTWSHCDVIVQKCISIRRYLIWEELSFWLRTRTCLGKSNQAFKKFSDKWILLWFRFQNHEARTHTSWIIQTYVRLKIQTRQIINFNNFFHSTIN